MFDGETEGPLDKLGKSDGAFEGRINNDGMTEGGFVVVENPTSKICVSSFLNAPDITIGAFIPSTLILMLPSPYPQHMPSPKESVIVKIYCPESTQMCSEHSEVSSEVPVIASIVLPLSLWRFHAVSCG